MKIKCLECPKFFIRPASHAVQVHGLTAIDYKKLHGLDTKKGIATEEYREKMREHVKSNGTIENLKKGAMYRFKKGQDTNYERSNETLSRLKKHFAIIRSKNGKPASIPKIKIACILCGSKKDIYPRQVRDKGNFCGVRCRNIANNQKRYS